MSLSLVFDIMDVTDEDALAWEKDPGRNLGRRKKTFKLQVTYHDVKYCRVYARRTSYANQVIDKLRNHVIYGLKKNVELLEHWQDTGKI